MVLEAMSVVGGIGFKEVYESGIANIGPGGGDGGTRNIDLETAYTQDRGATCFESVMVGL